MDLGILKLGQVAGTTPELEPLLSKLPHHTNWKTLSHGRFEASTLLDGESTDAPRFKCMTRWPQIQHHVQSTILASCLK
ncbi:hypothetical protein TNCV_4988501 [Trichonephila clavipes]|nr:hypothetical protein TNCV_4988501 [Trichonephila clavipes]